MLTQEKMGEMLGRAKKAKSAVLQWFVPTCVLIIIIVAMLYNFSVKSSQTVAKDVESTFVDNARGYAARVSYELVRMSDAGKPIGYLMQGYIGSDKKLIVEMAEALCYNTDAYEVIYYSHGDEGLLHDGRQIDITVLSYFDEIQEALADIEKDSSEDVAVRYVYVENDGLETARRAIIAIVSVDDRADGDKLLMYYPIELLQKVFSRKEYDGRNFYVVMGPDGKIIEKAGTWSSFFMADNIWNSLKGDPEQDGTIASVAARMGNEMSGSFQVELDGENRTCVYAPVGINNWAVVVGINQSYVDGVRNKEWENTGKMVLQLLIAIFVFFALVIIINIFNRIKAGQESRKLEEKADTDLLTSLNNKLATERKIKEYMEKMPNEQGLLFVLDIDNFKKINDTLGHAFGDEVLRTLGHSIGSTFRASDIIGRTGGDEFTIFLKHLNEEELLEKEAAKLCDFFKNFQAGEYVKYAATASIGAAVFPRDGKDFETLYKAADSALYVAKKRGKSQLAFYGDEETKSEGQKKVEAESRSRE